MENVCFSLILSYSMKSGSFPAIREMMLVQRKEQNSSRFVAYASCTQSEYLELITGKVFSDDCYFYPAIDEMNYSATFETSLVSSADASAHTCFLYDPTYAVIKIWQMRM